MIKPGEKVEPGHAGGAAAPGQSRTPAPTGWTWPGGWWPRNIPLTARVTVNRFWQQVFGNGPGEEQSRLWHAGRAAQSSGIVRLAGASLPTDRLECERPDAPDAHQRDLPPASAAPAERWQADPDNRSLARGTRVPSRCRATARSGAFRRRAARPDHGRARA